MSSSQNSADINTAPQVQQQMPQQMQQQAFPSAPQLQQAFPQYPVQMQFQQQAPPPFAPGHGGYPPLAQPSAPPAPVPLPEEDHALFSDSYGGQTQPSTHEIPVVRSEDGSLEVRAVHSRDSVLRGSRNSTHALIDVQSLRSADRKRYPFELIVVLDISGSMSGMPIDLAKKAIELMFDEIGPGDVMHLITYSSQADIILQNIDRNRVDEAKTRVRAIHASGGTNISDGLNLGSQLLDRSTASPDTLRAMFLLSDGHPNEGVTTPQGLAEIAASIQRKRCRVSSMGLGNGYNEEVMRAVSDAGEGDYLFIPDASDIPGHINTAFAGLTTCVATDAMLYLIADADHCSLLKAENYTNQQLLTGIPLGLLREMNLRQVVVHLDVNTRAPVGTEIDLFRWRLQYNSPATKGEHTLEGTCKAKVTDDPQQLQQLQMGVVVALRLLEVGNASGKIKEYVDTNRRGEAKALQQKCIDILEAILPYDLSEQKKVEFTLKSMKETHIEMQTSWNAERIAKKSGYAQRCAQQSEGWMYQLQSC